MKAKILEDLEAADNFVVIVGSNSDPRLGAAACWDVKDTRTIVRALHKLMGHVLDEEERQLVETAELSSVLNTIRRADVN